jgi:hypothetical protein
MQHVLEVDCTSIKKIAMIKYVHLQWTLHPTLGSHKLLQILQFTPKL